MEGNAEKKRKLWGGRFTGDTDPTMEKFNNSLKFDRRMWKADIEGSCAYAKAICKAGIITEDERDQLLEGLGKVKAEWASGTFVAQDSDEDIHTANERRLTEIIGPLGGKLHTGRSRNDQVTTDTRLWLRSELKVVLTELCGLLRACTQLARDHSDIIMAGYTHLQPAQPVRFSHWIMSHAAALERDLERYLDQLPRVNKCSLGCGALAGHAFGIDRDFIAQELGFGGITANSLDTVCDRDYIVEFGYVSTLMLTHLSQLSEDLIIFNLQKCVHLADAYATGSSLMPQKKNPDALELLRGKAGRALGTTTGFLATLKGLPRAYNKDLQEDKEGLFDTVDTVHDCLNIATGVVATLKPLPEALAKTLSADMLATDLAEYLVRKGVPFRETHHVAGGAVKMAEDRKVPLSSLTVEDLRSLHPLFAEDATTLLSDFAASVERKNSKGGTALASVLGQVEQLEERVAAVEKRVEGMP